MSYRRAPGNVTYLGYTRLELIWLLAIRLHNLGARAEHGLSATQKNISAVTMRVSPVPNTARSLQSGYAATRSKTKPENAPRAGPAPARRTRGCYQATGKESQGARGLATSGLAARPREPTEAAPQLTEPHEPPDGRAALLGPTPGPGPLVPRVAAGRERRETPPAGHPRPRAPRRPSDRGRAVIGRIPTPRCRRRPRSTPGPVSRRPGQENGGHSPDTHLAPRRPGKGRALARAAQIAAWEGASPAPPGEARAGRRAGRGLQTHRESAALKPERTFRVLARGGAGWHMRKAAERGGWWELPSRPASAFCASCGWEGRREHEPALLWPSLLRRAFAVGRPLRTSHRRNFRPLVSKCCSCEEPPESRPWHRGVLGLRSPRRKRGSACAAELRSSLSLPPSLPPGLCRTAAATARTTLGECMVLSPVLSHFITPR